ncbi:MAG: MBL fold metallo-hydrolase [Spirochaetota bacterium]
MKIELWGVRGSLPTPLTNNEYTARLSEILLLAVKKGVTTDTVESFIANLPLRLGTVFGGNTTCITVTSSSGRMYIIDAGTGIRPLGDHLMESGAGASGARIDMFFTHTHWDHVQGLPFFKPFYIQGNVFHFYSPMQDLHQRLSYQQTFRFFPREFDNTDSEKHFHTMKIFEPVEPEPGLLIDHMPLKHPGGSCAYRFRENGRTFIFSTDVEIRGNTIENYTPEYDDFFRGADLLIVDSQYTLDEAFLKFDWGHTAYTMAVNCGIRWNVKKLVLTHHEPSNADDKLEHMFHDAQEHLNGYSTNTKIRLPELFMATEGTIFDM